MTDINKSYRCARCGAWGPQYGYCQKCRDDTRAREPVTVALVATYSELRGDCIALEQLIERGADITDDERNKLDKAVTVMKVGFKIVKRVLRARGVVGRTKPLVGSQSGLNISQPVDAPKGKI